MSRFSVIPVTAICLLLLAGCSSERKSADASPNPRYVVTTYAWSGGPYDDAIPRFTLKGGWQSVYVDMKWGPDESAPPELRYRLAQYGSDSWYLSNSVMKEGTSVAVGHLDAGDWTIGVQSSNCTWTITVTEYPPGSPQPEQ